MTAKQELKLLNKLKGTTIGRASKVLETAREYIELRAPGTLEARDGVLRKIEAIKCKKILKEIGE
jgi:hypothetical protein